MRKILSFIVGLISLIIGLVPILNDFGVLEYTLPFEISGIILAVLMVIGAIILFIDASEEHHDFLEKGSIWSGLIIIIFGLVNIIGFFYAPLGSIVEKVNTISIIKDSLLTIAGFFLVLGTFFGL